MQEGDHGIISDPNTTANVEKRETDQEGPTGVINSSRPSDGTSETQEFSRTNFKVAPFDIGLIIAFPIIIGTLALFFLFPILAPEFGKTLPPPMSY